MDKQNIDDSGNKPSVVENVDSENERVVDALEADNEQSSNPDLDIDKIRDRTFNKELSDLVDKIKSNEETGKEGRAEEDSSLEIEETNISDKKLLLLLHKLFYKAVNLSEIETINTEFNPFALYKESSLDDLNSLIHSEMQRISLPEYAILVYDFKNSCYTCHINNISGLENNNLVLETSEKLFQDIINNANVYILDNLSIERDVYLRKRFTPEGGKLKNSKFLFISFNNLFKDLFNNIETDGISGTDNKILPFIMIRVDNDFEDREKKDIYNKVKSKLTVYFFLLYKKILMDIQKSNNVNINNAINFIDYEFKKYHASKDDICYVISLKNYINIEYLYVLEYLYIKLNKKLSNLSSISRIDKDKIILFTQNSKRKILEKILEDTNKIYSNILNVNIFSGDELNRRNVGLYLLFHQ